MTRKKADLHGSNWGKRNKSVHYPFFSASSACHFPTFLPVSTLYIDMQLNLPFHIKPVHTLLAAFALLAIAVMLFFYNNPVAAENRHSDTSEGAGAFHSPLMCI
ncbi:MAG: hypothetical protein V4557_18595 [Bacteroidota bacterium]